MARRRSVVLILITFGFAAGCASGPGENPDEYPSDEIRLTITYPAGGPTDTAARAVATFLEADLGQPVVPQNITGASGSVGTSEVANSEPDGYSLGLTTGASISRMSLVDDVGYTIDDIAPIGVVSETPIGIMVPADSEFTTAEQFFAAAEAEPDSVSIGHSGPNSTTILPVQMLEHEYGLVLRDVPFDGEAPSVAALLGGNVDAISASIGPAAYPRVQSGEFRVLAVGTPEPVEFLPDVPTLAELGYPKIVYGTAPYILFAPGGTPAEIIDTLESSLQAALADDEVRSQIGEIYVPTEFVGADDVATLLEEEQAELGPILEDLGN